jgi:hypothetical protein
MKITMLQNSTGAISKVKIGAVLIGLSALLGTIGGWYTGAISLTSAIEALITELGAVYAAFGVRDLPIVNTALKR